MAELTKARIIVLQKQLSVAKKALERIREDGISWAVAEAALDEIEHISFQEARASLSEQKEERG